MKLYKKLRTLRKSRTPGPGCPSGVSPGDWTCVKTTNFSAAIIKIIIPCRLQPAHIYLGWGSPPFPSQTLRFFYLITKGENLRHRNCSPSKWKILVSEKCILLDWMNGQNRTFQILKSNGGGSSKLTYKQLPQVPCKERHVPNPMNTY